MSRPAVHMGVRIPHQSDFISFRWDWGRGRPSLNSLRTPTLSPAAAVHKGPHRHVRLVDGRRPSDRTSLWF